jgi:hypothetical protein
MDAKITLDVGRLKTRYLSAKAVPRFTDLILFVEAKLRADVQRGDRHSTKPTAQEIAE